MPFKPNLSDWCAAGFWLTVLVLLPVLFDLVLWWHVCHSCWPCGGD